MTLPIWFEFFIFFGFWIFMLGFFAVVVGFIVWWVKLTPKAAKIVRYAIKKKIPLIAGGRDDGNVEFMYPYEITPSGVMKVKRDKEEYRFAVPRLSKEMEGSLESLIGKRYVLEGVPFWCGYIGKAVLTNLKALANIEYGSELSASDGGNPQPKQEQTVWIDNQEAQVFWPVDLRTLKEAFAKSWNQAQIRALELRAELSGMLKGKKYFGGRLKEYMPFMLMALLVIAIIVLGALLL